jgi:aminopeptidase N
MLNTLLLLVGLGGTALAVPAMVPDKPDVAAPDRHYDILTLDLDLALNFKARGIGGSATYTVSQLSEGDFVLDQVALDIESVTVDGDAASFRTPGETLVIEMPDRLERGGQAEVAIQYAATPRKGLHFRDVVRGSPDSYPEVWTQGQSNDNRYWFPAWDHPNERFDYTGRVTGPDGWKIYTNSGMNLPSYLIMIAAGPYQEMGDPNNLVWASPNASKKGMERVWAPVPDMMEHFKERTGVAYPWGTFRQVFVQRFMYGGMENTGAVINTNNVITPAPIDETRDRVHSLVAHELAHQWYGDYLTCRSWRDLWLNEGFASFFGDDWMARRDGPERWAYEVLNYFRWSQNEKPLAGRFFHGEGASTNHNVYSKGASTLQMLRVMLGEDTFWAGIRDYTKTHAKSLVRTHDLQESMESVSGQELGWFFQQWVELPHVPRVNVSHAWSDGTLTITVKQEVSEERPAYALPFEVEVGGEGEPSIHTGRLIDAKIQLQVSMGKEPSYVSFDPKAGLLLKLEQTQEPEAWEAQLDSPHPVSVFRALRELTDTDKSDAVEAVLADTERHFLMRMEAAKTLGKQRQTARLLPHADDAHDGVRRAAIRALGNGLDGGSIPLLERRLRSDPNPDVRTAALEAITQLSSARGVTLARTTLGHADSGLAGTAAGILGEHGELSDLGRLLSPRLRSKFRTRGLRAAGHIIRREEDGAAQDRAMAKMSKLLVGMLGDLDFRARQTAVSLLTSVGDKAAIAHLEAFRRVETVSSLSEKARKAVEKIRSRESEVKDMAEENQRDAQLEDLEDRIEELEAQIKAWSDKH